MSSEILIGPSRKWRIDALHLLPFMEVHFPFMQQTLGRTPLLDKARTVIKRTIAIDTMTGPKAVMSYSKARPEIVVEL